MGYVRRPELEENKTISDGGITYWIINSILPIDHQIAGDHRIAGDRQVPLDH